MIIKWGKISLYLVHAFRKSPSSDRLRHKWGRIKCIYEADPDLNEANLNIYEANSDIYEADQDIYKAD